MRDLSMSPGFNLTEDPGGSQACLYLCVGFHHARGFVTTLSIGEPLNAQRPPHAKHIKVVRVQGLGRFPLDPYSASQTASGISKRKRLGVAVTGTCEGLAMR